MLSARVQYLKEDVSKYFKRLIRASAPFLRAKYFNDHRASFLCLVQISIIQPEFYLYFIVRYRIGLVFRVGESNHPSILFISHSITKFTVYSSWGFSCVYWLYIPRLFLPSKLGWNAIQHFSPREARDIFSIGETDVINREEVDDVLNFVGYDLHYFEWDE